jgi:hypothetical protein
VDVQLHGFYLLTLEGGERSALVSLTSGKVPRYSAKSPNRIWSPISFISNAYGALSPGVKQQRREVHHLPPYNVDVKNGGAIPPLPHIPSWYSVSFYKLVQSELYLLNFYLKLCRSSSG